MWPFKDKELEGYREFINLVKECHEKEIKKNILYYALLDCCMELSKYERSLEKTSTDYFINKVKSKLGY